MATVLSYSDTYMPLATLVVYLILWRYIKKAEWFILLYCIFSVVLFGITNVMADRKIYNMPLYHFASIAELGLVSFYLLKKINGKNFLSTFLTINGIFLIFFILNIVFWEDINVFNSNSAGLVSLIILFLCMYYLLKLSKSDEILYFQKLPSFWIVSGFLIYSAVSVLVLLSYKYLTYLRTEKADLMWYVLDGAIIIKFALISIGLLCHRKQPATHLPFLL